MTLLLALLLTANPDPYFRQSDGGVTLRVWADGVSGSAPSSGGGWVPDGGYIGTAGVNLIDGGVWVKNFPATQGVDLIDAGVWVKNFPTTQPVSIASMPSTPVTGTFWQATQPVSGTFWQATQPISGSVTATVASTTLTGTSSVKPTKVAATMLSQAITCAATATAMPVTPLANRTSVCVQNFGASVIYVGHSGVTTANGLALAPASGTTPGGSFCDDIGSQPIYCIVAAGTVEARIVEN